MDDVITVPPPTSILTWAVVAPSFTSSTLPLMMLRALSRMSLSPSCWLEVSSVEAARRDRQPRPRGQADRLEVSGDPAVLGPQMHVHVRFLRSEDAAVIPRVESDQLDRSVLDCPSHLRLLVSLWIVGQVVPLVEHVERGQDGGGADPGGERTLRIETRRASERNHFARDVVETRSARLERALGPRGDGGPYQEAGPRAPRRGGHHSARLDPRS